MAVMQQEMSTGSIGFFDKISQGLAGLYDRMKRRAVYRGTIRALSMLSDRELADIGISRSEIRRVALESARTA